MSLDNAQELITQAMADRSVYGPWQHVKTMWGAVLPAFEHSEAKIEDMAATETAQYLTATSLTYRSRARKI